MPSVQRSKLWYIRITSPWEFIEEKIKVLREQIDTDDMMVGYHIGEKGGRPHAHIALKLKSEPQKQSLDVRLKRLFGDPPRSDYSSKIWDGNEDALAYLYHDKAGRVAPFKHLQIADIERLKSRNEDVQKIVAENKTRASNRMVDYALEKIKEAGYAWNEDEILQCYVAAVQEGCFHHPGTPLLERYIVEVMIRQDTSFDNVLRMTALLKRQMKLFSTY